MQEQEASGELEPGRLQAELAAEREALLAIASGVDEEALAQPSRNPGWAVRDVLAHVLASDADLISLLEAAARPDTPAPDTGPLDQHEQEMARWAEATPQVLVQQLRECGHRWRDLLAALPTSAFASPAQAWWSGGARKLGEVVADWRGHDSLHAEDVRLALGGGTERKD